MIRRILLLFGYVSVAMFVVIFTVALVAYGNDYTYDFSSRKIVQRGHVIIESVPNGSKVTADGKLLKKNTPYQAAWSVGQHEFQLTKDRFVPWRKTLNVVAGQVSFVQYAILVPKNPPKTVLDTKTNLISQNISKDHRHLAYVVGGAQPALYTLNLDNAQPELLYSAVLATPTAPGEVLEAVTWSDDASRLLLQSSIGGVSTYRVITASSGDQINVSEQFKFDFSGLTFSSNNSRQLYWISPDGLRRLDLETQTVSAVLADKVTQFWIADERVLYVQQSEIARSLWSLDDRARRQQLIQALPASETYSVAYSSYRGQDQLAVVPAATQIGTLYNGILTDNPNAKVVARGVTTADFSPDGHLVVFSSPKTIVAYDLDRATLFGTGASYTISDQPGDLEKLSWFDNNHLLTVRSGRLYWSEYDGANRVDLGAVMPGVAAHRSADFRSIIQLVADGSGDRFRVENVGIR